MNGIIAIVKLNVFLILEDDNFYVQTTLLYFLKI